MLRSPLFAPLVVGAVVLALALGFAQPAPGAGDQSELAVVALRWGVAHPTGYPLWTALAHAWTLLFASVDAARALAWLSALLAAVAAGLTVAAGRALGSVAAGVGAALLFWWGPVAWQQATQVEVYPLLYAFFAAEALCLARAWTSDRPGPSLRAAALVGGLGATHHLLIGLWVPAALWVVWRARARLTAGDFAAMVAGSLLPLALYGLLPWRAGAEPAISWNRVTTLDRLWMHVSASQYGSVVSVDAGGASGALLLAAGGAVPLALLLLAAAGGLARASVARGPLTLTLALAGAFGASWTVLDQEVFFLPFLWVASLAAGLGIAALSERIRVASVLLVGLPAVSLTNAVRLDPALAAHDATVALLQAAPRGAVAWQAGPAGFNLLYPVLGLGMRPDLALVDTILQVQPRYLPELEALRTQPHPPGVSDQVWVMQTLLAGSRPVVMHPEDPDSGLAEAGALRLRAGVVDLVVPRVSFADPLSPGCGDVRFAGGLTLTRPCAPGAPVDRRGVVSAPLGWALPAAADLTLVVLDAPVGVPLNGGQAARVYAGPLGMGRPPERLPTDRGWTDPLWVQAPRDAASGSHRVWIGVRRADAWVPVEDAAGAPTDGPFVALVDYAVSDAPAPPLWTLGG